MNPSRYGLGFFHEFKATRSVRNVADIFFSGKGNLFTLRFQIVIFFKILPLGLHTLIAKFLPLLETYSEVLFRNGLQFRRRILYYVLQGIKASPLQRHFQLWKYPLMLYLAKYFELDLNNVHVLFLGEAAKILLPKIRPFSPYSITDNLHIVFLSNISIFWSILVMHYSTGDKEHSHHDFHFAADLHNFFQPRFQPKD